MKLDCDPYSWFQGLVNLDVLSKKKIKKKIRLRSTMYKVVWARIWIITASVFG